MSWAGSWFRAVSASEFCGPFSVGIVAALIGSAIAGAFDVADTKGVDWVEWLIQIGLAALGVAALDRSKARR